MKKNGKMNNFVMRIVSQSVGGAGAVHLGFDTDGVSVDALKVVNASVSIAVNNPDVELYKVPRSDFCAVADLPENISKEQLRALLKEACKVLGSLEVIDESNNDDELAWVSWGVFTQTCVSDEFVEFEIQHPMFHDGVYSYFFSVIQQAINFDQGDMK